MPPRIGEAVRLLGNHDTAEIRSLLHDQEVIKAGRLEEPVQVLGVRSDPDAHQADLVLKAPRLHQVGALFAAVDDKLVANLHSQLVGFGLRHNDRDRLAGADRPREGALNQGDMVLNVAHKARLQPRKRATSRITGVEIGALRKEREQVRMHVQG